MKDKKVLWIDTETTGLNEWKQDIIQLAGMVEVNNEIRETFNFTCQPHNWDNINQEALKVHGMSVEFLEACDKPLKVWNMFCRILDSHVNKFDKEDKFILAAYNAPFDMKFLQAWWTKCEQQYFGSYITYKPFDVYPIVFTFADKYEWDVPNHRLETIAPFLGVEINAHDALSDIEAARDIYYLLRGKLPEKWEHYV